MKTLGLIILVLFISALSFFAGKTTTPTSKAIVKESTYERVLRTGEIRCAYASNPPTLIKDPNTGELSGVSMT